MMFDDLMSRWMTPLACAASSASAIWPAMRNDLGSLDRPSGHFRLEGFSLDVLHDNEVNAGDLPQFVDRGDVRVVQHRHGPRFMNETPHLVGHVARIGRENLQRHEPTKHSIAGEIDFAHPAEPSGMDNLVMGERMANHRFSHVANIVHRDYRDEETVLKFGCMGQEATGSIINRASSGAEIARAWPRPRGQRR